MEEAETGDFDSDIAKYSTGDYFNPVLGRSANSTYLFFGSIGEEDETGKINYVNLNDVVSTDELTKITDGGVNYYVPNQNVISAAMDSKNVMDFDVSVDSNGKIYLFYNDSVNGALQIMTAMLDDSGNAADDKNSHWTEAIQLTDVPENIYYMGLGAAIIDDMIYIGAGKANYKDEADKSLVLLKHVPTSDVVIDDISVEKKNFKAGEIIEVSALMRNKDILPETKPVNVVFTVNGNKVDTKTVEYTVPGGFSSNVNAQIEIPENPVDITFAAYVEGNGETKKITVENGANLVVDEQQLEYVDSGSYIFKSTITNVGGKPSDAVSISAVYGNTEVETLDVPALMSGETRFIEMTIEIDAEEFGKERDTTSMTVGTVYNDETIAEKTVNVNNPYYWDVVDTIAKVTDIKFEDSYTIQKGESLDIQPVISGVDAETLKVWWDSTSDGTPVEVDGSNIIYGDVVGTVTINGHIVPFADEFDFDKDGSAEKVDWLDRLPESSIIEVSAVVNVVDDETESTTETTTEEATESTTKNSSSSDGSGRSYGGGNASSKASVEDNGFVFDGPGSEFPYPKRENEDYIFNDISGHWAQSIIEQAARDSIVKGYEDNSFKPNNSITRAEFV
ncbi:MAG: S-layer homology domain-containing protein, partial [Firmicutes bacterium]|nr:S-layer homology domain-containing protein [Bacillota bacterium]